MSWTTAEIEEQSERQPKLGIALMQMLVKRGLDYQARLESFALDKTPERVVRSLLRFADPHGYPDRGWRHRHPAPHAPGAGPVCGHHAGNYQRFK